MPRMECFAPLPLGRAELGCNGVLQAFVAVLTLTNVGGAGGPQVRDRLARLATAFFHLFGGSTPRLSLIVRQPILRNQDKAKLKRGRLSIKAAGRKSRRG